MRSLQKQFLFLLLLSLSTPAFSQTFHSFTVIGINGDTIPLSQYAGKKVLVVNTASYCGYTYQFGLLQALDSTYSNQNFEVVGFPCNDFGGQDPYADSVINGFCTGNYGVTFQMMKKISITAIDTAPVYKWLQRQDLNGVSNAQVTWNFNKFCIDEAGHWVKHLESYIAPFDTAITNWINSPSVVGITDPTPLELPITVLYEAAFDQLVLQSNATLSSPLSIDLLDISGRKVSSLSTGKDSIGTRKVISLPRLKSGLYLVQLRSGGSSKIVRISVTK